MNVYKNQETIILNTIKRVNEYLTEVNFAITDYSESNLIESRQIKYESLQKIYKDYLMVNSDLLIMMKKLDINHEQQQNPNKPKLILGAM